jgi:hypothetical protein
MLASSLVASEPLSGQRPDAYFARNLDGRHRLPRGRGCPDDHGPIQGKDALRRLQSSAQRAFSLQCEHGDSSPWVWSRVATLGGDGEPTQVVLPADPMELDRSGGQSPVSEAHDCLPVTGCEGHLHRR